MEVKVCKVLLFFVNLSFVCSYSNQGPPVYGPPAPPFQPIFPPPQIPQAYPQPQPPSTVPSRPPIPPQHPAYPQPPPPPPPPAYPQPPVPTRPQLPPPPPPPPVYSNDQFSPIESPNKDYQYALPLRKVTSCPSFASFKFACQLNHLLSIESVVFSQVFVDERGECVADWKAECRDDSEALDYTVKQCAGQESCTIYSYNLRSRTKCNYHQVISVFYRCVPTFEVVDVPIKCDICKNVTVNGPNDMFGFIHSAWYPKLYPRETCHSLIQNKPDHFIIIYSVSGFIGLDRIEIESVNQYGALVIKETLTGNITTQLVLTSAFNVNITVLTSDMYYQSHRQFLLYFFIVPKCTVVLCSNVTGHPGQGITSVPNVYPNASNHSTFAPPLIADSNHGHKKLSDAWLAAILALAYALLMVFAVLLAIYCRRRRRQRCHESNVIFSPSAISQSQIINPLSRAHSQISLRNEINLPISANGYLNESGFYSHVRDNFHNEETKVRQYDEEYSQVVTEEDNLSLHASTFMNYGDVDVQDSRHDVSYHGSVIPNSVDLNTISYPFSMRTNTQHGSIMASGLTNDKNLYRAVEFTKGPQMERVCVRNMDDDTHYDSKSSRQMYTESSYMSEAKSNEIIGNEKTYVVKLYPVEDKEVQEMTMYVDNRH